LFDLCLFLMFYRFDYYEILIENSWGSIKISFRAMYLMRCLPEYREKHSEYRLVFFQMIVFYWCILISLDFRSLNVYLALNYSDNAYVYIICSHFLPTVDSREKNMNVSTMNINWGGPLSLILMSISCFGLNWWFEKPVTHIMIRLWSLDRLVVDCKK
jgi:hypothetical protein